MDRMLLGLGVIAGVLGMPVGARAQVAATDPVPTSPWRLEGLGTGIVSEVLADARGQSVSPALDVRAGHTVGAERTLALSLRLPLTFIYYGQASIGLGMDFALSRSRSTAASTMYRGTDTTLVERTWFAGVDAGYTALYGEDHDDVERVWRQGPYVRGSVGVNVAWLNPITGRGVGLVVRVGGEVMHVDHSQPATDRTLGYTLSGSVGLSLRL